MTSETAKTRSTSAVAIVLFFAALWTPLLGMFFGVGQFHSSDENRVLAQLPSPRLQRTAWFDFGTAFTKYFHDHFGFRGTLITAHALLKVKVLGVLSSPNVVLGREGWLFYAGENSMENYRGVLPFTSDELASWVALVTKRSKWLELRGISAIVVVVPDKQSVYPEYLPPWIRKVRGRTRLDKLIDAMRNVPGVCLIDLREALVMAKTGRAQLYYRTDTHWAGPGVYASYLRILSEIAKKYPDVRPVPFFAKFAPGRYMPGDLVRMLGLGSIWREIPEEIQESALPPTETVRGDLLVRNPGAESRRLILFGDSFSYPLIPYLAQHFGRTTASRSAALEPELIDREHPEVVLFEMVERKLNGPPPRDPVSVTVR